ncbi:glycosyltransferase [Streptomyces sp. NPDC089799]|uniref:glycosyltransferase n=1 Tax=Streptomyces sp. NPDC089799 TaxID=3155066 RepID=UPI003440EA38
MLFVVPPLAGHVNPTVAVGSELASRGHRVAWAGPYGVLAGLLPSHARVLPAGEPTGGGYAALHERWRDLRGVAALRFLWDEALVPLARAMVPGVTEAVRAFRPDVVVADQQALAGPVVARRLGVPWATSASTSAELTGPFEGFPKVGEWVSGRISALLAGFEADGSGSGPRSVPGSLSGSVPTTVPGTGPGSGWDPRFSERLVLVFSTPELVGAEREFPDHYAFVGPAFGSRPPSPGFPWQLLDPGRRRVLVSLGTLNREAGGRFYAAVAGAAERLAADGVQLVLAAPPALVPGPLPEGTLLQDTVPQLDLLPHLDAVVTHGGHNTVCEALAHGLPLVVAPIRDDQPFVAQQVVAAGAGLRVRFGRTRAEELRDAITAVLDDPVHRRGARRVQASFAAAGGAAAAADRLEKLA